MRKNSFCEFKFAKLDIFLKIKPGSIVPYVNMES